MYERIWSMPWVVILLLAVVPVQAAPESARSAQPAAGTGDAGRMFVEKEGVMGTMRPGGYYRLRYFQDSSNDGAGENVIEIRSDFRGWVRSVHGDSAQTMLSVNGRYDTVGRDGEGRRVEQQELEVWEAFLKARTKSVDIWLGKQVIRWGKSDEINPTDNFTPEDFSEFTARDRADRKIPVWMVRGDYYADPFTYEFVFLPYFVPSPNIPKESDWYLPVLSGLEASGLTIDENVPEKTFKNCVVANKISYRAEDFDMSLSYASHFNETASLLIAPPNVVFGYERQNSVGGEFEVTTGEFGFRGEGVYTTDDPFSTSDQTVPGLVKTRDTVAVVVGADHTFASDVYVNVQYYVKHVMDFSPDLAATENDQSIIWSVSRKFLREDLEILCGGRYYVDPRGYYVSPEVRYRLNDHARLRLLALFMGGNGNGLMGQWDRNDQVGVELKLLF